MSENSWGDYVDIDPDAFKGEKGHVRCTIASKENIFKRYGKWMLRPEDLVYHFGKIDFSTVKFFNDWSEIEFEGGGSSKYIPVKRVYSHKSTKIVFDETDLIPDPWLITRESVVIEFDTWGDI